MNICKVINNNVLSAYDEQNQEVVIMGRGIGFKAKAGDVIDESKIEKVFYIENHTLAKQFQDIISNMPLEHMQISADIISYAKNECRMKLNQSIYVALTDHINFAIARYRQNIQLSNAILWEIRAFYQEEYRVGEYGVKLMEERLNIHFSEDEAGFIALHFVNAEYDTDIRGICETADLLQKSTELVKQTFVVDETSVHYERFITHMKFFMKRLCKNELLEEEETVFADLIEQKYPQEYACGRKLADLVEQEYGCKVGREEVMYFTIHIRRVILQSE